MQLKRDTGCDISVIRVVLTDGLDFDSEHSEIEFIFAYLQYQRILNVDWHKVQTVSQNGIDWVADVLTHISGTISTSHPAPLSNIGIPLVSSVSAGFVLGMVRG
jgi:hypothetical protein